MVADFLESITPFFVEEGYTYKKSLKAFCKPFEYGEYRFELDNYRGIEVGVFYGIRFKVIEEIQSKIYEIKLSSSSKTVFINLSRIIGKDEASFYVMEPEETDKALDQVKNLYETYAKPYFEKYSTLDSLDNLINTEDFENHELNNAKFHTPKMDAVTSGLIVRKLINESAFEELKAKYDILYQRIYNGNEYEDFKEVVSNFDTIDFEKYRKKLNLSGISS